MDGQHNQQSQYSQHSQHTSAIINVLEGGGENINPLGGQGQPKGPYNQNNQQQNLCNF
jgi:hypothetical protein